MSTTPDIAASAAPQTYTPGFALPKLLLAALGLVLMALALTRLGPDLALGLTGGSTMAEAIRVIQRDSGGHETVLTAPADVADAEKRLTDARERQISLWIEYRFSTADGRVVEARSPIGTTLKPMHPYRDADGLPATIRIWYDPTEPSRIVLPFQFLPGTWYPFGFGTFFVPGMLFALGFAATAIGLLLWWHAKKPIVVPDLSQAHGEAETRRVSAGGH
jgi:hypothetical protein